MMTLAQHVDEHFSKSAGLAQGAKNSGPLIRNGDFEPLSHPTTGTEPASPHAIINHPPTPAAWLTRRQAAQYVTGRYFPVSWGTLAKLAMIPDAGPRFRKASSARSALAIYGPPDLDEWAIARMSDARTCFTAEAAYADRVQSTNAADAA